ncbi:MAG: TonB family protein [Burkholderiaceae bacterium]|nr:TonB family protein [Burkholderiaceae bacterium]
MARIKTKHVAWATAGVLAGVSAGCSVTTTPPVYHPAPQPVAPSRPESTMRSESNGPLYRTDNMSLERYKRVLAERIVEQNPDRIYAGNPQALLRSVIVMKYVIDADGRVVSVDTVRSNGDSATLATAHAAIRQAAPYPAPPHQLLSHGKVEIVETMLFNTDGRFQPRTIAQPQLTE